MKKQIFTEISLNNIKIFNFLKNISFPNTNKALESSIKENGLIYPLIVVKKFKDYYIVDGYRRFLILKKYNFKSINISWLNYYSEKLVFIQYLKQNLYRKFNEIELSNLLNISENYFKDRILTKYIFAKIGKKFSNKNLTNFINLTKLHEEAKIMLINNQININLAVNLSKISNEEQLYFIKLINSLKLNANKQKKTFDMIFDLSKREELDFKEIIEKYFSKFITQEYSKDIQEKFFKKLISIHSPEFFNYNEKFQNLKKELLKNEKGINIVSPSNFEDDILKAEIYFKNKEELLRKLKILERFNFQ